MNRFSAPLLLCLLAAAPVVACGGDDDEPAALGASCDPDADKPCQAGAECVKPEGGSKELCLTTAGNECDPENAHCTNGLTCAELDNGEHRCFGKVMLTGDVTDTSDNSAVEGAQVIAVDEEGVAVTDVAESDAMGNYSLEVPVVRAEDGTPQSTTFTLKAAAQDYQPFPSGARVALPIQVSDAAPDGAHYVVESALTQIGLIPLEDGDRTKISGKIVALADADTGNVGGVLVVAASGDAAFSGISDKSGNFTIFNVTEGDYVVQGYAADIQLDTEEVAVAAAAVDGVTLNQIADALATVTGSIQLVNAPGGAMTSVILVVADTFDEDAARGEAPRGLRAPRTGEPNVTGEFTIEGVPVGTYKVLAAYENDGLVRDPDTNIAGTDILTLEVPAGETSVTVDSSFKVTEALATVGPGVDEPEAVDGPPELVWADDSSEDYYEVRVFDAFGNEVWNDLMVPSVSGGDNASIQYEGPLDPGMYYQFRVTSWRSPGGQAAPIAATEDLRGVFYLPAQ